MDFIAVPYVGSDAMSTKVNSFVPTVDGQKRRESMKSNSPSYACMIWYDRGYVYAELACGLIQKYGEHELYKVVNLLKKESKPTPILSRVKTPKANVAKKGSVVTPEERDAAMVILKRRGDI